MKEILQHFAKDRTEGNKAAPATGRGLVTAHTGRICVPVAGLVGGNHAH